MTVTKLEAILCGLLVLIVCVAGFYLPGLFVPHSQDPPVHLASPPPPARIAAGAKVTHHNQIPRVRTAIQSARQQSEKAATVTQQSSPAEDSEAADLGEVMAPLALVDPPDGVLITEEQLAAFNALRQEFVESLAAFAQDPAAPEYRGQWQEAQEMLDDEFAALFGVEAYNQQQNAVVSAALQTAQP
jgi:hypothetical protein